MKTIKEVSELTGLSIQTLRYYDFLCINRLHFPDHTRTISNKTYSHLTSQSFIRLRREKHLQKYKFR